MTVPASDFATTRDALKDLWHRWSDEEIKLGLVVRTLFTIAVILVRHYIATMTALVSAGAWYEYGVWAIALGAVVPASFAAGYMRIMMMAGGVSSLAKTWTGLRRARKIRQNWEHVLYQLKISGRGDGQIPPLRNVRPSERGVTGEIVVGSIAMSAHKLVKLEQEFASGFFCDRVTIKPLSPSMATISWEWGHHLRKLLHAWDVPTMPQDADKPALAAFGVQDDGDPAYIVSNLSILVGGLSGGGKSSTIWAILNALQAVVPIRVRIVDPSGVEFAEAEKVLGKGIVHDYISDTSGRFGRSMDEFYEDISVDFDARMESVKKSGERWHRPTKAEPLDVLVIDEILPLAPHLKKDVTDHIVGRILFLGRKAGFMCIAASQAGQVDVLGRIRDLFPQRICHRTKSRYVTDAFLGDGAEADGARCSTLDTVQDVGIFYIARQGEAGYTACRSALITNRDVKRIVQGLPPIPLHSTNLHDKPTSLYAMYDIDGALLYVGIAEASRLEERWKEHARTKSWFGEVADMHEVDQYKDRYLAETAEEMMIKRRRPKYNKQHNTQHANV